MCYPENHLFLADLQGFPNIMNTLVLKKAILTIDSFISVVVLKELQQTQVLIF